MNLLIGLSVILVGGVIYFIPSIIAKIIITQNSIRFF